jgi:hypothetical protein
MSLSINKKSGVKLKSSKQRGGFILVTLIIIESVFSFFLYLSLAGKIFAPPPAQSAYGVPEQISYQGRLTDTSGNPLGGTGTPYCFRYSIYDDSSAGSKLWPSGTPATSSITVADGVFSDQIGRTGLDSLATLDFMSTSTLYLNVEVNTVTSTCTGTWSALLPRQQITSAGFAQTAQNIYGDRIRTNVANKVQIGTGAGQATSSITLLSLDVANVMETVGSSCTNNGTLWYNSSSTRAYICEAGLIQAISNASTTIGSIGTDSTSTLISSGNVMFSASTNITISQIGNTLKFFGPAAGGGGAPNISIYLNDPGAGVASANFGFSNATLALFPLNGGKIFPGNMTLSTLIFGLSGGMSATSASSAWSASNTQSFSVGFYSLNGSTLSLAFSASTSIAPGAGNTNSALSYGPRNLSFHSSQFNVQPSFSQTNYWVGIWQRSSNYAAQASWMGHRFHTSNQRSGNFGISAATATSMKLFPFWGHYSASFSTAMPVSIAKGNVVGASAWAGFAPYLLFNNFDSAF